jgi:hypothetical protein
MASSAARSKDAVVGEAGEVRAAVLDVVDALVRVGDCHHSSFR